MASMQQSPEKVKLQNDLKEFEDCTPCRVLGASTFIGLGVYSMTLPREHFTTSNSNAALRTVSRYAPQLRGGMGAAFIIAGVYRLIV